MANTQFNTRIILRNDSTAKWLENEAKVLLKGEVGIEFLENGSPKMKIGDGVTQWKDLSYFGGEETHVIQVDEVDGETHVETITKNIPEGTTLHKGDIAVAKATVYIDSDAPANNKYAYTAYVYGDNGWAAMDGNYSADNVFFNEDMIVTTKVGTITELTNGSATFKVAGKSVKEALNALLAEEKDPVVTLPKITSITANNIKAYEVGTNVTVDYTINTDAGNYEYGPATGVTYAADAYNVAFNSETKNTKSGSFTALKVTDNTNLSITATATYSDGVVPLTNLKSNCAAKQIKSAATKAVTKGTVTGYRNWYTYVGSDLTTIDSVFVRKTSAKGSGKNATKVTLAVPAGTKRVMVAIPTGKLTDSDTTITGYTKRVKGCIDEKGMGLDIFAAGNFATSTVSVFDATGNSNGMDYIVYDYTNENGLSATNLIFDIG